MAPAINYGNVPTEIYRHLRERILRGKLHGGDQIKIGAVAEHFGVSAIPVREAMRMLAADHLVDILPRRSPVVSGLSQDEVLEIAEIRLALEPLALVSAIPLHSAESIARCAAVLDKYQRVKDPWKQVDLNRDFHLMLYQPCPQKRLMKIIAAQYDGLTRCAQYVVIHSSSGIGKSLAEHHSILQACRAKDMDKAEQALRAHLEASIERLHRKLAAD